MMLSRGLLTPFNCSPSVAYALFNMSLRSHWLIYLPVSIGDLRVMAVIVKVKDLLAMKVDSYTHIGIQ